MKRIELYLDNNGRLVLSEFKSEDADYESKILKGIETYEYIRKLASYKIVDVYENIKRNVALLEYDKHVISINDYGQILNKRGMAPLIKNIKEYSENQSLTKNRYKKVKRKNKHIKKRILAGGLALIIIGSCASNLLKKENKVIEIPKNNSSTTQLQVDTSDSVAIDLKFDIKADTIKELTENAISIDYEDRSSTDKAYITKANYGNIITKYADMYGVDPQLALAVATQERGIHSSFTDPGGATGLMQIQNDVWVGETLTAYNFETKQTETYTVTLSRIQDLEYNIKFGCMILQNVLKYMNYNALAALQCYNMGYGHMGQILTICSKDTGKSVEQILNDVNNTDWMKYRNIIKKGDQEYVEHVLSWLGEDIEFRNLKRDGSFIEVNINNNLNSKKVY